MTCDKRATTAAFGFLLFAAAFSQGHASEASPRAPAAAPRQSANPSPRDSAYRQYRYRLRYKGHEIAGFRGMGLLHPLTPGRAKSETVTLKRGVTQDSQFQQWANSVTKSATGAPPAAFRKNVSLEVYNEAGQVVQRFTFTKSWVSQYSALPVLNANGNAVAIEHIKIEVEGWVIDTRATPSP